MMNFSLALLLVIAVLLIAISLYSVDAQYWGGRWGNRWGSRWGNRWGNGWYGNHHRYGWGGHRHPWAYGKRMAMETDSRAWTPKGAWSM